MKARNQHIYSADQEYLKMLAEETRTIGREYVLEDGHLTIFALPRKHKKSRPEGKGEDGKRNRTKRERWYGKARD